MGLLYMNVCRDHKYKWEKQHIIMNCGLKTKNMKVTHIFRPLQPLISHSHEGKKNVTMQCEDICLSVVYQIAGRF